MITDLVLIGAILFLIIIVSAFFSGVETALTSVDRITVSRLSNDGNIKARRTENLINHIERVIGTVLVGNNLTLVIATTLTEIFIHRHAPPELEGLLCSITLTPLIIVFGEMLPKSLARSYPLHFSMIASRSLEIADIIFRPINALTTRISNQLALFFDIKTKSHPTRVTRDDLRVMAELAVEQGLLPDSSAPMFSTIFQLDSRLISSVMVPVCDINTLPLSATIADVEKLSLETGFGRFPVYEGRHDNIIGVIELSTLLFARSQPVKTTKVSLGDNSSIAPYIHGNVIYIPESKSVGALLQDFRYHRIPMAMVVDEHGNVVGMVTADDLVEEVVGNLSGKDREPVAENDYNGNLSFECPGNLQIRRLSEHLGVDIKHEGFDTVSGLVMKLAGRIPVAGDTFTFKNYTIHVLSVRSRHIEAVRFNRRNGPT